jgi:cytochrome c-type biogenesis protein CcmH/NrfG
MGWFSVSFPGSKKAGKREISDMRKFATRYEYKLRQNPDKKGWTIFGRMK